MYQDGQHSTAIALGSGGTAEAPSGKDIGVSNGGASFEGGASTIFSSGKWFGTGGKQRESTAPMARKEYDLRGFLNLAMSVC